MIGRRCRGDYREWRIGGRRAVQSRYLVSWIWLLSWFLGLLWIYGMLVWWPYQHNEWQGAKPFSTHSTNSYFVGWIPKQQKQKAEGRATCSKPTTINNRVMGHQDGCWMMRWRLALIAIWFVQYYSYVLMSVKTVLTLPGTFRPGNPRHAIHIISVGVSWCVES